MRGQPFVVRLYRAVLEKITSDPRTDEAVRVFSDIYARAPIVRKPFVLIREAVGLLRLRREMKTQKKRQPTTRTLMLESVIQDLKFAVRNLARTPGFTAVAVITLALGIGANTAIYTVIDSILLEPLPYRDPGRLAMLWNHWTEPGRTQLRGLWLSQPEIQDYRSAESLESVGAIAYGTDAITGDGPPVRIPVAAVESSVFEILGVDPLRGRALTSSDDDPGASPVAVLGHGLWRERYGSDPEVVGKSIVLDGVSHTVVGVMPPEFSLPLDQEGSQRSALWKPLQIDYANPQGRGSHYLFGVARLAPGVTVESANRELAAIGSRLTEEGHYPPQIEFRPWLRPLHDQIMGDVRPALLLLLGAVGFVLLIMCANVANLLFARSQARNREMAVRSALGAVRGRLISQMLTESLVLALIGGVAGMGVAFATLRGIVALDPAEIPRLGNLGLDLGVLGFAFAVSVATGVVFGIVPALHASRPDLQVALKEGGRSGSSVRSERIRRGLVVTQVSFAVLLVIGGGLMLRSFWKLNRLDPGFTSENVLTMLLVLPSADYSSNERVVGFYRNLLERVRGLPGVAKAGLARNLPLANSIGDWSISLEGREPAPGTDFDGDWQVVSDGYIEVMDIPLLEGRTFTSADGMESMPVALINKEMADQYWPGESPIGKRFDFGRDDAPWITIVGVVGNVRHNGLTGAVNRKFYIPHAQWGMRSSPRLGMFLVLETESDPSSLAGAVRAEVRQMDPNLPVSRVRTYEDIRGDAVSEARLLMTLLVGFGLLALTVAAVGVYGVISYSVSQRVREIGVRIALGASARRVTGMVVRQGVVTSALGVVVGGLAALGLTRVMSSVLYGVGTLDPVTFMVVPALIVGVAAAASIVPALRAARIPPGEALRYE